MRSLVLASALVCVLVAPALAQPATDPVAAWLAETRPRYHQVDARAFTVRLELTNHEHPDLTVSGHPWLELRWTAPFHETYDLGGLPEDWRKPLKDLTSFWVHQDLTAGGAFGVLEHCKERELERTRSGVTVIGAHPFLGPVRVTFDGDDRLQQLTLLKANIHLRYQLEKIAGDKWRVESRQTWAGKTHWATVYHGKLARAGGQLLPQQLTIEVMAQQQYDLVAAQWTLDRTPAPVTPLDDATRQAIVDDLDARWRSWDDKERARRLRKLPELAHPACAKVLSQRLRDRRSSKAIRQAAAVTLGELGQHGRAAVPELLRALDQPLNQKEKEVYFAICDSLGKIGDPGAIERLGVPVIQDRAGWEGYWARAKALGEIRDKRAIDALMKMLVSINKWKYAHVWPLMVEPLKNATGQDFGADRAKWRRWWRDHRQSFRFAGEALK